MAIALVYSYFLDGHRQVWSAGVCDFLIRQGWDVRLLTAGYYKPSLAPDDVYAFFKPLVATKRFEIVHLSKGIEEYHLQAALLVEHQRRLRPGCTFIVEISSMVAQLKRHAFGLAPAFHRHTTGLMTVNLRGFYTPWAELSWADRWHYLKFHLKHRLLLCNPRLFSGCYYENEEFVARESDPRVAFLPDFACYTFFGATDTAADARVVADYAAFLQRHPGKDVLLYFGMEQMRRGPDALLDLALEDTSLIYAHFGSIDSAEENHPNREAKKARLRAEGRIFEYNEFVRSPRIAQCAFESIRFMVLPYRDFYAASGVMAQAMEYGAPVLVPDVGLMARRVRHHRLGLVYRHGQGEDLRAQCQLLRRDVATFSPGVKAYYDATFSKQSLDAALSVLLRPPGSN